MMAFFPGNFMLETPTDNEHQPPPSILPTCTPGHFHGVAPMLGKRSLSFSRLDACREEANDGFGGTREEGNSWEDGSHADAHAKEKKRRLNVTQVKALERNFEPGKKLDPERKMQLAEEQDLQPRQVAIWFQNRKARWKTKQLEKDYEILKRQFQVLKVDNQSLHAQNHKLQAEISTLKGRQPTELINLNKETDQDSCSNRIENISEIKLDISTRISTTATNSGQFFPPSSSSIINRYNVPVIQLLQTPQTSRFDLHSQKFDQSVKEESFTNMFSIDDQFGFWPWIEQHNLN